MSLIDYEKTAGPGKVVGGIAAHDVAEAVHTHMRPPDVDDVVSSALEDRWVHKHREGFAENEG